MIQKLRHCFHSITAQIISVIFLLLLPVIFLSGYINYQFMRSGKEQVAYAHTQLLESYMSQLDRELDLSESYMNSLTFYNSTTVYLTDRSSPSFFYSANTISREIAKTALYYQYITGFFLRSPGADFQYTYIIDSSVLADVRALNTYIDGVFLENIADSSDWQFVQLEGGRYLMQGYQSNGLWGGSFLNLDRLPGMGSVNVCMDGQLEEVSASLPKGNILLSASSQKSGLMIYEVFDQREALSSLPFLQRYLVIITAFMALSIPLVYLAMRRLEEGDLQIQLETSHENTREFEQIDSTFNHMTQQIKGLKIAVYEEQLQAEKIRLQNLSYQLRPHFMVNSLNMAYNMITCKEYSSALKLMRFSAGYMRYLLRLEDDFVPLQAELKHMEDYLNIQLLRYEGQFDYKFTVNPFVEDISIPSMVLKNFIEHSIKIPILAAVRPAQIGMKECWRAATFLVKIGFEEEANYNAR